MIKTLTTTLLCISGLTATAAAQGPPLMPPPTPPQNPYTAEKAVLGKMLFWEEQLSSDDTMACGTCHTVTAGFGDNRIGIHPGPDGIQGNADDIFASRGVRRADHDGSYAEDSTFGLDVQVTGRRTPEIFAALYAPETFWDGRGTSSFTDPETGIVTIPFGAALESQAIGPILNDAEMAHESVDWAEVTAKLASARPMALATDLTPDMVAALLSSPTYPELFQDAFGTSDITAQRIAYAIATYERTLIPDESPWDLFNAGDPLAMTPNQIAGWNQFNTIANCNQCHTPPMFTDNQFHNLGLRPSTEDAGRQDVTGLFADRGKFKTPSLRNAGLRTRYFHNGSELILDNGPAPGGVDMVYINGGGAFRDNLDPLLVPLAGRPGINMQQIMDFVANGLTDPRVENALPPFDKPTLFSEANPAGAIRFGPSNMGGNGVTPTLIVNTPAALGSTSFKVGLENAPATASIAWLGLSRAAGSGTLVNGVPFNLGGPVDLWKTSSLQTDSSGLGYATFQIDIPSQAGLLGMDFHVQAFVEDLSAPGGTGAATRGATFTVL
ncbi:MAG: cytochrome-c peroxidase [Planctomycetota bacterium]